MKILILHFQTPVQIPSAIIWIIGSKPPAFFKQHIPFATAKINQFTSIDIFVSEKHDWNGDWKDARAFMLYPYRLHDGKILYAIMNFEANLLTKAERDHIEQPRTWSHYIAAIYILLVLIVLWRHSRRIDRAASGLVEWADQLSLESLHQPRPTFRYAELDRMGELLQSAFQRIATLLEKEHRFLRNASHELRTPIAVIRANSELAERMGIPASLRPPLTRIHRANQSMQMLTETLLWLSRDTQKPPKKQPTDTRDILNTIIGDLQYLLEGKPVTLSFDYPSQAPMNLSTAALSIVLSNLIRNAFQHTQEGRIEIDGDRYTIHIRNYDTGSTDTDQNESFGLGLTLVKQICKKLNWPLTLEPIEGGLHATLHLS